MNLTRKIKDDLKEALINKDENKVTTLRLLISAISYKEIEDRKKDTGMTEEEIEVIIRKEVKKREDAIEQYSKGNRKDLADEEALERNILKGYLPKELGDDEVKRIVEESIRETSAENIKDFGEVMKSAMASLNGKASGKRVSDFVRDALK